MTEHKLTGRLFQSEGALNTKTFLPTDLETAGTKKKSCVQCLNWQSKRYLKLYKIVREIKVSAFIDKLEPVLLSSYGGRGQIQADIIQWWVVIGQPRTNLQSLLYWEEEDWCWILPDIQRQHSQELVEWVAKQVFSNTDWKTIPGTTENTKTTAHFPYDMTNTTLKWYFGVQP